MIINVEALKTDVTVFIDNLILMCVMLHLLTIFILRVGPPLILTKYDSVR